MHKDDRSTDQATTVESSGPFDKQNPHNSKAAGVSNQLRRTVNASLARQAVSLRRSHQRAANRMARGIAREQSHIERERRRIEAQKERLLNTEQNHLAVQKRRFARGVLVEQEHLTREQERFARLRARTNAWQDRMIASRRK